MPSRFQLLLSGKRCLLCYCQIQQHNSFFSPLVKNPNYISIVFLFSAGNIRNTERLSYDKQQSYKIMVTAFDCGQKRAKEDVVVHIEVKPVCKPGWQG